MSWRGLLGMGFVGGLLPSPSAVVVLLGAIALGRAWFGVLLVLVYGLGMAATLTGAGLLLLRARDALEHRMTAAAEELAPAGDVPPAAGHHRQLHHHHHRRRRRVPDRSGAVQI